MKRVRLLLFVSSLVLMSMSCRKDDTYHNPSYDRMNTLSEQFKSNPKDNASLLKLKHSASSSDYWDRYYAFGFLETLAIQNIGECREGIIPLLANALEDT